MVERFFGDVSRQALLDTSFTSPRELAQSMRDYIDRHNGEAKRYGRGGHVEKGKRALRIRVKTTPSVFNQDTLIIAPASHNRTKQ